MLVVRRRSLSEDISSDSPLLTGPSVAKHVILLAKT